MLGPLLVATRVNSTTLPTYGEALLMVLTISKLEDAPGTTVEVELLFPGVGSAVALVTAAVLAQVPATLTVAVMCNTADTPLANAPTVQAPVPDT